MFKNVFTICVDMDDTIENLLDTWVAWLNDKYNLDVTVDDCKSWQLSHVYPSLTDEQIFEPLSIESFWSQVKPKSDAQYYINKLIEDGQEIYICTASHYDTVAYKMRAIIEKHFPAIDWKHIIVAHNKSMIKCDVIVDDGPHNLLLSDGHKILYDAVHNKSFNAEAHKIKRCNNWEQIFQYMEHLDWFYYINGIKTKDI